ncbi:MAG TPA: hypothetical protein VE486_02740, partial [Candidatus Baltobacteraceae bacterium]|nr:hypothetical protein [Candidatus Baltobacteraceae bacterium]
SGRFSINQRHHANRFVFLTEIFLAFIAVSLIFQTESLRGKTPPSRRFKAGAIRGFLAHGCIRRIHVAHVIIDGVIDKPGVRKTRKPSDKSPLLEPEAIADSYWQLIEQDRSAWSLELDLRPHNEAFFE